MGIASVTVYMGSSFGSDPAFAEDARALGVGLAERGLGIVYGGGDVGLMGVLANAALGAGGTVTGVITRHLMTREVGHPALHDLVVVDDMGARKREMFDRADAFITLPGGVGTMEEFFEVLCWRYMGLHPKPVGLLNTLGFYDDLLAFLDRATASGFIRDDSLVVERDAASLLDAVLG